jgi:rhodanese-related sulfurtransferase
MLSIKKGKTMMKKFLLFTLMMTALLLVGCSAAASSELNPGEYTSINVETLAEMMDTRRESFVLVNTHIPFEGDLPTTDFSVPYNKTSENLDLFPEDKSAEIVLYCLNDPMSLIAAEQLTAAGYSNVKVLTGGMNAWQSAGLTLEFEP